MENYKTYLSSIYFNPVNPASFSSVDKLYKYVRRDGKYVLGRNKIRNWLLQQESYAVHREARSSFRRRRVIAPFKDYQFDADTADMSFYSSANSGFKYFVLLIDIFSRYVWTVPLKSKKGTEMVQALDSVFSKGRVPTRLRTDKGTEFLNKNVEKYLKDKPIKHFQTQNETKSSYAERSIKTIKGKISQYMTYKQTHKWANILESITESYNNSYHRSIKQTPKSITDKDEVFQWRLQYDTLPKPRSSRPTRPYHRYKFKIGELVRIQFLRRSFQKQHDERWSRETYTITDRSMNDGIPQYALEDYAAMAIKGKFYQNQLIKAYPSSTYLVEKTLGTRLRGRNKEILVKWKGWGKSYNSYIKASELKNYSP